MPRNRGSCPSSTRSRLHCRRLKPAGRSLAINASISKFESPYAASFRVEATDLGFTRDQHFICPSRQQPTWVAESPESSNQWQRLLDSGLAASRRPGMTSFTEGMTTLATESNPFRLAIVGSGPSGFYAAEALLRRPHVRIDMFDRLPTPFGLVRGGVAPDHPKIKQVCLVYDKIARSPGFAFWGNVEIGKTLTIEDLARSYHVVVLAYGASADRLLGIPGEHLQNSHTSTEFVGWYNGHPDYHDRAFDLSARTAVIIGQGNVAADIARMLATPSDELSRTDITQKALEALAGSRICDIHVVGRRGPAQAKFTSVELKELGQV